MYDARRSVLHAGGTWKMQSSASLVECHVCGRGLTDGHDIVAKTLPRGTILLCDVHYSLQ